MSHWLGIFLALWKVVCESSDDVKAEPGSEHSDYRPGAVQMGCEHITREKLGQILKDELQQTVGVQLQNLGVQDVTIQVHSIKLKKGRGTKIESEKTWGENDQKVKISFKYVQRTKVAKRRDTMDIGMLAWYFTRLSLIAIYCENCTIIANWQKNSLLRTVSW